MSERRISMNCPICGLPWDVCICEKLKIESKRQPTIGCPACGVDIGVPYDLPVISHRPKCYKLVKAGKMPEVVFCDNNPKCHFSSDPYVCTIPHFLMHELLNLSHDILLSLMDLSHHHVMD